MNAFEDPSMSGGGGMPMGGMGEDMGGGGELQMLAEQLMPILLPMILQALGMPTSPGKPGDVGAEPAFPGAMGKPPGM